MTFTHFIDGYFSKSLYLSFDFCGISCCSGLFAGAINLAKMINGPKYDGKYLHELIKRLLGGTRLHDTLTAVVIPTFDIKTLQPVIFSSYEVCLILLYNRL